MRSTILREIAGGLERKRGLNFLEGDKSGEHPTEGWNLVHEYSKQKLPPVNKDKY